jgi:hypothetical protein
MLRCLKIPTAVPGARCERSLLSSRAGAQLRFFTPYGPSSAGSAASASQAAKPSGKRGSSHVEDWRAAVREVPLPKRAREAVEARAAKAKVAQEDAGVSDAKASIPDGFAFANLAKKANGHTSWRARLPRVGPRGSEDKLLLGAMTAFGVGACAVFAYVTLQDADEDRLNQPYPPPPDIRKRATDDAPSATPRKRKPHLNSDAKIFAARMEYRAMEEAIFGNLKNSEYADLGFVDRKEVQLTVAPHAFTQYGVIEHDGIDTMVDDVFLTADDVFVDVGSGIGNVLLQVLAVSPCSHVVGVELLPSRQAAAHAAEAKARELFPKVFTPTKKCSWIDGDVVAKFDALKAIEPTVIFTHSWMFDADLLAKLGAQWATLPKLRAVVTSRPMEGLDKAGWEHEECTYAADWNPAAPFHVYRRNLAPA